jgi:hypothetical protein
MGVTRRRIDDRRGVCALPLLNGKIAGISGIVGGLFRPRTGDVAWRIAFVTGLVMAPLAFGAVRALPQLDIAAATPC